jgi:DNA-binding response OmpR family regulator
VKPPALAGRAAALLVTDDPELAAGYRLKLELDGYDVAVISSSGRLPRAHFDLLFFDLADARPSRVASFNRLHRLASFKELPALVITDRGREAVEQTGVELRPFDGVIARSGVRL